MKRCFQPPLSMNGASFLFDLPSYCLHLPPFVGSSVMWPPSEVVAWCSGFLFPGVVPWFRLRNHRHCSWWRACCGSFSGGVVFHCRCEQLVH
ncbi:hypothetical protein P8452_72962 [Trifolium repens]|nr:hypothetical protein QL285_047793 [Trifolium repens]WJX91141.1 hypothetical protein P8452_72962 [Trifolium repens]